MIEIQGAFVRRSSLVVPVFSHRRLRTTVGVGGMLALVAGGLLVFPGTSHMAAMADTPVPTFVQQAGAHLAGVTSAAVTPAAALGHADRLIVEVGVWSLTDATAKSVTDSAGDAFTEISHTVAGDGTEQSVWTAVVGAGTGLRPVVTATATGKADVGLLALEYGGLSTADGTGSVDVQAHAVGQTGGASATSVSSGATGPVAASGELAVAFYTDSGFGDTLTPAPGYTRRAATAPVGDMEQLAEDKPAMAGDTPDGAVGTGANTYWVMSTVVFRGLGSGSSTVPGTPTGVVASPGNGSATVSWAAPTSGGGAITSYTVTPYLGGAAQTPVVVSGNPPQNAVTVTGLANGSAYTFTVTATNAIGAGPASAASAPVTPGVTAAGQWTSLASSPLVAIHDMYLPNGKFLQFDGWQQPQPTYVFDPVANTYTQLSSPDSIFCAGNAFLPDGRVLTVGGYGRLKGGNLGIKDTAIFDPGTSSWTRVADMNLDRWYPTLTELPDGRYVAISGNSTDENHWADTPEVYDPTRNTWTLLTGISTAQVHEEEYPFSYLAPNGKVFTIGPSEDVSYYLDVNAPSWTSVGASGIYNGSSVQYRPGKILYSGGAPSVLATTPSTNGTAVIDLNAATPAWRATSPMNQNRVYHTLTMLADGRVLAVGGSGTSDQNVITTGVLPTEIWDPATETWSPAAPIAAARNYHSTAALMADGRVLISGGGHPNSTNDPGEFNTQIYSPSYLFNGARPTITAASSTAGYNAPISVSTPDAASITAVNLVSFAADTHQIDMNQRFIPLSFTAGSGGLTVQAPASAVTAPPGYYMLFLVNGAGVPSVAATVRITAAAPSVPAAPTGVAATAGNGSATVTWTTPANGGSALTSYTVTPSAGGVAQTPVTVTGAPPATRTTVSGLTNGTAYTFTVTATNAVGTGPASAPSAAVTPSAPTAPGPPTGVTAVAGNASARVSWTAPATGGSPLTSYTVTPYQAGVAQTPVTVTGTPPATGTTVSGLTNGTAYTFTVAATNAVGSGPASAASGPVTPTAAVTPAFVQQVSAHKAGVSSVSVTPAAALGAGDRLIVATGEWNNSNSTVTGVTDSAGDSFTEVSHVVAADGTEQTVWTAPITAGAGARPTVKVATTAAADLGVAVLEYSGLSTAAGAAAVDGQAHAVGRTGSAGTVSSGAAAATGAANELAFGFYADSGFGDSLSAGSGFAARATVAPTSDLEFLAEDRLVPAAGTVVTATVGTGAQTYWTMSVVVFRTS